MIVIAIVGVLAALGTYGVRQYVAQARASEARTNVGRMAKDAASAFQRGYMDHKILKKGRTVAAQHLLCASASRKVPRNIKSVRGRKYQSSAAEWKRDESKTQKGFACLAFSTSGAQSYQYDYRTNPANWKKTGRLGARFEAIARGDLDGDKVQSELKLVGEIVESGGAATLIVAPQISELDVTE